MRRVSVEAGVTDLWWKYLGCQGEAVGINRFGFSAPGTQVLEELGMNVDNVVAAVHKVWPNKQGIFPLISFQGLFRIRRDSPFSCLPGCQEKARPFSRNTSIRNAGTISFPVKIPFVSRPDFSKYKTSAHQLHYPNRTRMGLRPQKPRLQAARFHLSCRNG